MKTIRNIIAVGLIGLMGLMGSRAYAQCDMPTALAATHITGTAATITWDYDTAFTPTGFSVIVSSDNYPVTYPVSSNERRLVLTDLEERTSYLVQLTTACTGADTVSITFVTSCVSGGELVIGDGSSTNSNIPVRLQRIYSLSQQIFTAAEMDGTTTVSGVRFYKASGFACERQLEIYMDTTSVTAYSTTADYVPQDTTHRFFVGTVGFPATGWVEIVFDSTFTIPVDMNVILTVNDLTGTMGSFGNNFQATGTADCKAVYGSRTTNQTFNPADSLPFAGLTAANSNVFFVRSDVVFLTPCDSVACYPPYITDADPDVTSIDLQWVASASDNCMVEYRQADSSAWNVAAATVSTGFYTITNLAPATDYVIRVTTLCTAESSADSINVTTLCPIYTPPFTEGFDDFVCSRNSDDMQRCWYRTYENSTRYPRQDISGTGILEFSNRGALVLPEMDANIDTLAVSFLVKSSDLMQMETGVATDPMDTATYTVLRTATVGNYADEWEWVTVYLDNYGGEGDHIFVRIKSGIGTVNMDSIVVDYIPACRQIAEATVVERTDSSLTLVVADEGLHDSYTLYYGTIEGEQNATDSLTVTGTTVTINGLASNTTYYIYVRGNCGVLHGPSHAVRPTNTLCVPVVVTDDDPYIEDFEGGGLTCMWQQSYSNHSEWQYVTNTWLAPNIGGGDTTVWSYFSTHIDMHSGGGAASLGITSRRGTAMLVLPTFDFSSMDSNAALLFYYFQEADYDGYYEAMADLIQQGFDVEVDTFPHALEIYYRVGVSGTWNFLTLVDTTHSMIWKRHVYTLPASAGAASYQVAILGRKGDASLYGVLIDDIRVGTAATICDEPTAVSVSDVSDRFATVHWTGNASSYSVQWRRANSYAWQGREVTGGDTAVIGPLEVATHYVARVVAQCSLTEQSEPSDTVVFTTDFCPQSIARNNFTEGDTVIVSDKAPIDLRLPCTYVEMLIDSATLAGMTEIKGFDFYVTDAGLPQLPPGMELPLGMPTNCRGAYIQRCEMYMGHTTDTVLTDFQHDSTFSMLSWRAEIYFSDTGRCRVYFDTAFAWDGHSNVVFGIYQYNAGINYYGDPVSFAAHSESGNKVYGGFGAGSSTFTLIQGPISLIHGLNSITPERRWTSNVVPNLTFLGCEPVCHEPTVTHVNNTTGSVSVGWYDRFANIELQIKEASDTIWTGDTIVNTLGYTFTGLSDMTTYDIRLRRVCSVVDGDYSGWVLLHAATGAGVSCSTPTNLTAAAVTRTSATIGWTDGPVAGNRWQLHVWNSEWERYYDANTHPVTIDGLMPNSSYHVAVRANCGEGIVGAWSDDVLFDNTCHLITDLVADEVGNSAEVTWAAGSNNIHWIISYGYQDFDVNQTLGYYTVDTTHAIIDNLHNGSTYGFRVMPVCGDGWYGEWSGEATLHITGEGIDDVDGGSVRLFPNPASHTVTVSGMDGSCTVTLFDMDGRTISEFHTHGADLTFNLDGYARGAYFVRITNDRATTVRKLVVK